MHSISKVIFFLLLAFYLITIFTVSYVGVYLTYVAIPILVISGAIAYITKPKENTNKKPTTFSNLKDFVSEEAKELNKMIKSDAEYLKDLNNKK